MTILDEKAWHDFRRQGVGASDISALIGLSRYSSPTALYYTKLGLLEPDEETQRQRIGKRMEALLAAEFHDETGLYVVGEQTWATHPEHTFARCTLDGFVAESADADIDSVLGNVEFKTDGRFGFPDGLPHNIRAQVVFQLGVTQQPHAWVVVMFAGFRVEIFEVPFDDDARADWLFMLDAARRFWCDHVLTGTPPPVDDHDATVAALTEIYHDPEGMLDADDRARELVATVQRAMSITAAAEATEKRFKNELRALLGEHTDLVDGTKPAKKKDADPVPNVIASWRPSQRTTFDHKAALANDPSLEKYNRVTDVRTLRVQAASHDAD